MVRAIFTKGQIQPLDPLPEDWRDGQELAIALLDDEEASSNRADIERWHQERLALSANLTSDDEQQMQTALDEQRRLAKEQLKREWEQTP